MHWTKLAAGSIRPGAESVSPPGILRWGAGEVLLVLAKEGAGVAMGVLPRTVLARVGVASCADTLHLQILAFARRRVTICDANWKPPVDEPIDPIDANKSPSALARAFDNNMDKNVQIKNVRTEKQSQQEEKVKAEKASMLTARYLWNFLSGMSTKHKIQAAA